MSQKLVRHSVTAARTAHAQPTLQQVLRRIDPVALAVAQGTYGTLRALGYLRADESLESWLADAVFERAQMVNRVLMDGDTSHRNIGHVPEHVQMIDGRIRSFHIG